MKSEIGVKKFRGVEPINALIVTVLEGCGEPEDPYREERYIVQVNKTSCVTLGKCSKSTINLDMDEDLYIERH